MSISDLNQTSIVVRPLVAGDSSAYRALRQKILSTRDALYFSDSYDRESHLNESEWLEWCTERREHCILGTFDRLDLVGIIMVTQQGRPDSPVVEWEAAWLAPRYRGTGIGKMAYEKAREWSRIQGYKFVAGFIRATYTPALDICMGQGFVYAYTIRNEVWADGSIADTHAYLLDLRLDAHKRALEPVHYRFKEAFQHLSQSYHAPERQDEFEVA